MFRLWTKARAEASRLPLFVSAVMMARLLENSCYLVRVMRNHEKMHITEVIMLFGVRREPVQARASGRSSSGIGLVGGSENSRLIRTIRIRGCFRTYRKYPGWTAFAYSKRTEKTR
jgi:hypothetical protein